MKFHGNTNNNKSQQPLAFQNSKYYTRTCNEAFYSGYYTASVAAESRVDKFGPAIVASHADGWVPASVCTYIQFSRLSTTPAAQ